jgi:hypothetical protein
MIENPNLNNYSTKWITSGNIQPLLVVDLSVERGITSWLTVYAGASVLTASFIDDRFVLNLGVTAQL